MKTNRLLLTFIVLLMTMAGGLQAAEETPPWLQPHVLKAYVEIGLTDEQKPEFNKAMANYVQKSGRDINRAITSNKGNLDREIRRIQRKHLSRWSKSVAKLLTPEQYPKFEVYRDTLVGAIATAR